VNITLENIDLRNPEHVEHVIASLRASATIPAAFLGTVKDITVAFDGGDTTVTSRDAVEGAEEDRLGIYGKTTRTLLQTMLARAKAQGSTTLEEVATDMGVSLDTARANLRNAGRTAAAYKVSLPLTPVWNAADGRNEYRIAGAKRTE